VDLEGTLTSEFFNELCLVKANLATEKSVRMSSREVYAQVSSIMLAGEETVSLLSEFKMSLMVLNFDCIR
jgi:hypothetical protein